MTYEKPEKLSELLKKDEKAFAEKVSALVTENYKPFAPYRDKCWRNERVWRNRHWDETLKRTEEDLTKAKPNAPTLYSTVENIVADVVDNIPDQIIRGVNYDDDMRSIIATELVRFVLQRAKYADKFEKKARKSIKTGVGTLQAFWNPDIANGMGDIDFRVLHIDNIIWDKSVENVNDGKFFAVDFMLSPEAVYDMFPDIDLNEAMPEDQNAKDAHTNETEDIRQSAKDGLIRVTLFQWKEKEPRRIKVADAEDTLGNRTWINSCFIIGNKVLDEKIHQYEYDRFMVGMLPHIEIDGEPVGLSAIDIFQDDADVINFIEQQYLSNLQASAKERFLVNRQAGIDERELLDYGKPIVHGNQIHAGAVTPFKPTPFTGQALNYRNGKMAEIKEQSGQSDFNNGQAANGVTSGYGIEQLKASGAKRSRLHTRHFYSDHADTVKDVLKLAQTHYSTERVIRLTRETQDQIESLIKKAAENLQAAAQKGIKVTKADAIKSLLPEGVIYTGRELKVDFSIFSLDYIDLDFDIEIIPQRKNNATSAAMNEFLMMLINSKAIDGELAIELWEMEGKDKIIRKIRERADLNARLAETQQQAEQMADQLGQYQQYIDKLSKENTKLQEDVWDERFKNLEQRLLSQGGGEEQQDGEQPPESAEEAIARLKADIANGLSGQQ